jgi:hypothetical protein
VDRQDRLPVLRFQFNNAHRGAPHRLADRLSVDRVGLASLHVGLHVARRHQLDVMAELAQFASAVMAGPARRLADDAGWQGPSTSSDLAALDGTRVAALSTCSLYAAVKEGSQSPCGVEAPRPR